MNIAFQEVENMRYGLIGEKLGHSFSKEIHEKIADYTYDLIPLTKHEFHTFMKQKILRPSMLQFPIKRCHSLFRRNGHAGKINWGC